MSFFSLVPVRCSACGGIVGAKQLQFEKARDELARSLEARKAEILSFAASGLISEEEKEELAVQLEESTKKAKAKIIEDLGIKRYCCIKELINAPEYAFDYLPEEEVLRGLRDLSVADPALLRRPQYLPQPPTQAQGGSSTDIKGVIQPPTSFAGSFVLPTPKEPACKMVDVGGGFKVPQRPCRVYQLSDIKYSSKQAKANTSAGKGGK